MRHWSQLGIRNWRTKPGRTLAGVAAIALGVGVVIWVTCAYESVRLALSDQVWFWIGRSHMSVESVYGAEGTVYEAITPRVSKLDNVDKVTQRLQHRMRLLLPETELAEYDDEQPPPQRPEYETLLGGASEPELKPADEESGAPETDEPEWVLLPGQVQAIGIDPATEYEFRDYAEQRVAGEVLQVDDTRSAVMDRKLADELGIEIGDRIAMEPPGLAERQPGVDRTFMVIGLIEHRRVAKQQLPVVIVQLDELQALVGYDGNPRRVTKIDVLLEDTGPNAMAKSKLRIWRIADSYAQGFLVTSAEAKLRQIEAAEEQTSFVLLLISCVALFTAFFIILSTLSMGMVERIGQLGMLRCVGVTRWQMAWLVLVEAVPLGVVGVLLGIPVGLGLAQLSVIIAPEYVGTVAINQNGLWLALGGGAVTTLAGALLPMIQAMRISPLAASKPMSKAAPAILNWIAAVIGIGMIFGHTWMIDHVPANRWVVQPEIALLGVSLLYCGYALITPAAVRVVGQVAVRVMSIVLRLRHQLLSDQIGKATWRSAAICCGLMVGLSLIVTLVVHSSSLAAGWDFPKDFSEAFVYLSHPVDREVADEARRLPGVLESSLVNENIRCTIYGRGLFFFPVTRFVAGDPDDFFDMINLEFVEGEEEDAIAKLREGGHILVTPEFCRAQNFAYGDPKRNKVRVTGAGSGTRTGVFEIAGVVTSPALDIAANYFNAGGMLVSASVHVILGTFDDARKVFRVPDQATMFLINFDLPKTDPTHPPAFEADRSLRVTDPAAFLEDLERWRPLLPQRQAELDKIVNRWEDAAEQGEPLDWYTVSELRLFRDALRGQLAVDWNKLTPAQRWQGYREELVMRLLAYRAGTAPQQYMSVRALKQRIDQDLRRATLLFSSIPMVAMIVAALGVANLMMANVANRAREIATLRAIGTTKWQVTRLIIGEALVLGSLGAVLGMGLGLHAAGSMRHMTKSIWGYEPVWTMPWDLLIPAIILTLGVCLVAGLLPARHAARSNVIAAMQTT